jgi:hypothetical protein
MITIEILGILDLRFSRAENLIAFFWVMTSHSSLFVSNYLRTLSVIYTTPPYEQIDCYSSLLIELRIAVDMKGKGVVVLDTIM